LSKVEKRWRGMEYMIYILGKVGMRWNVLSKVEKRWIGMEYMIYLLGMGMN